MANEKEVRRLIRQKYSEMPESFKRVAKYIIDHYSEIALMSVNEVADKIGVSDTMVIRFAKYLGFGGYSELRRQLKEETYEKVFFKPLDNMQKYPSNEKYAANYMRSTAYNLQHFIDSIDYELIDSVVTKIIEARRLYVAGVGTDATVANFLFYYLTQIGFDTVLVCNEGHAMLRDLRSIDSQDVLLMSSYPQLWRDEKTIAHIAKKHGATLITITDSDSTAMLLGSDYNFSIRQTKKVFFNSYVTQMSLCNLILIKIYERIPERVNTNLRKYIEAMNEGGDNI